MAALLFPGTTLVTREAFSEGGTGVVRGEKHLGRGGEEMRGSAQDAGKRFVPNQEPGITTLPSD